MAKIFETRDNLIDTLNHNMIIGEIGVFKGEFAQIILDSIKPKELHLIDIFQGTMCSGNKDGHNIVWINLDDEYKILTERYSQHNNVIIHKGISQDILLQFNDGYFDMLYIDADHTYEGTMNDLLLAKNKVKTGGVISGHDYTSDMFPGVVRAVDEFCEKFNLSIDSITKDGCPTFLIHNL